MIYSLFIGRWQVIPPHAGHITLIETALSEGRNALIAVRDVDKDDKNPFSAEEIKISLEEAFKKWGDKVKVIIIPDIDSVCYGRKVGYEIREIKLSEDLENISGTKIREANKKELWQ